MRYTEEVELLLEEMRRVLAFLEWDGNRWRERAQRSRERVNGSNYTSTSPEHKGQLEEGLRAYAQRQASVRQCLFETFAKQWHDVPAFVAIADRDLANENAEVDVLESVV
jgi:hypothetical protein